MHAASPSRSPVHHSVWLIAGILLIAANLRAPVTAVGPVMGLLQQTFALSAGAAGLADLATLCFALVSPLAGAWRAAWTGAHALLALLLIAGGIVLRSSDRWRPCWPGPA
jgi:CP family cyanate transporter-like MFS transporter